MAHADWLLRGPEKSVIALPGAMRAIRFFMDLQVLAGKLLS